MAEALEHESGLLALAGTADMREVLVRADTATTVIRSREDLEIARQVRAVLRPG